MNCIYYSTKKGKAKTLVFGFYSKYVQCTVFIAIAPVNQNIPALLNRISLFSFFFFFLGLSLIEFKLLRYLGGVHIRMESSLIFI
jgi:hypothetical protein